MKSDKIILKLGKLCLNSLISYASTNIVKECVNAKPQKENESESMEDEKDLFWECFDEMMEDIRQMHRKQDEQGKRLDEIEKKLNISNSHGETGTDSLEGE